MADSIDNRFIAALGKLERERNLDEISQLFAADAEIGNVIAPEKFHGPEGARDFWGKYRDTFTTIKSTFRNQITAGDRVVLEWTTIASSGTGKEISYDGVSILEVVGDRITRFRAYFDAGSLGRQLESAEAHAT